jgi:hypothetical protein
MFNPRQDKRMVIPRLPDLAHVGERRDWTENLAKHLETHRPADFTPGECHFGFQEMIPGIPALVQSITQWEDVIIVA